MLTRLLIQNLATVEKQILEFEPGFTALTGETGAGKSVILKAIRLILGEKCSKDLIRNQEKFLSVEAAFSIQDGSPVFEILTDLDIEPEEELTIRRKVHLSGKNSIFINDHSVNLSTLFRFGEHLIDLHGQHSQQSLISSVTHIDYLDAFAGIREPVHQFSEAYKNLIAKQKLKNELSSGAADRNREIDFTRFQITEIDEAGFTHDEELKLQDDLKLLSSSEHLINTLSPVADWKSGDHSPLGQIAGALSQIKDIGQIDPRLQPVVDEIQSGLISLEEASSEISAYVSNLEVNPLRLEEVNQRLADLDALKRKYGATLDEIFQYRDLKEKELARLESQEFGFEELETEINTLKNTLLQKSKELTDLRTKARSEFEKRIFQNLTELGMERCNFSIHLEKLSPDSENGFNSKGADQVSFLIATNPGNPLKPIAKIASGGELSRIMLAIKTALNQDISSASMIFDEVDAGISGRVAETVGYKLDNLAQTRQIICITHSPQIASKASTHLKVQKIFEQDVSKTLVYRLKDKERVEELAQFLSGDKVSDKTRSVAKEMLTS